jgi:rhamnogalacturonan endolyase
MGKTTVWKVVFHMDKTATGSAYLRVALAGANALRELPVSLNGQSIGAIGDQSNSENMPLINNNSIRYNNDKGLSQQRTLKFDAALLKAGDNELTFTVPGGDLQAGVVWDYLRLELNEGHPVSAPTPIER